MTALEPQPPDPSTLQQNRWPGVAAGGVGSAGGEDAGVDLVIHYASDGQRWLWEIEHASQHPEHIAAALAQIRRFGALAA